MISHHHKCIFVHIPKNAGQSIEHVFLDLLNLTWETRAPLFLRPNDKPELGPPRLAHLKATEYVQYNYLTPELFNDYFKFTFVRNPWARMVSIYMYLGFSSKYDFKTFLFGVYKDKIFKEKFWFVGPQSDFIYDDNGDLLVDFVGRVESLQHDFNLVCEKIGIPLTQVPHINESRNKKNLFSLKKPKSMIKYFSYSIRKKNFPIFKCYQDYYDQETIDFVADIYQSDIELFSYEFV